MSQPPDDDPMAAEWRGILMGTDPRFRKTRLLLKHIPAAPRCKMCAAPFHGPGAPVMRIMGRGPWPKNPKFCSFCFGVLQAMRGGAEIPCTLLFADMRGSTALAERISSTEFSRLMNRFYHTASQVLITYDGIVDKFVGDEVIGIFIPALTGEQHALRAVEAARVLLAATGNSSAAGPWVPLGIGIHTGVAFVGSVGEPPTTDLTALGDTVNIAARLASAAGAGEMLVTETSATAAGLDAGTLERRHLDLKGKSVRIDVLVVHQPAAAAIPA